MKNTNVLIIVLVTIVALGVIATVILASVLNSSDGSSDSSTGDSGSRSFSEMDSSYSYSESSLDDSDSSGSSDVGDSIIGDNIVNTARSILEREPKVPFSENGASLDGFDNSGFIYYVLRENGFMTCPRGLNEQTKMAARLEFNQLKRGDLVFFCNEGNPYEAGYGGIYIGDKKMIACLMPGTFVQEVDISGNYYAENFYCGVSLS